MESSVIRVGDIVLWSVSLDYCDSFEVISILPHQELINSIGEPHLKVLISPLNIKRFMSEVLGENAFSNEEICIEVLLPMLINFDNKLH